MNKFSEYLEHKFLEWQQKSGKRQTLNDFADYLEIKRPLLSLWLSGLLISQPDLYEHFPEWIRSEDPALINRLLTSILKTIIIHHDHTVEIVWRK